MKGRRIAALLCVLLLHAFVLFLLFDSRVPVPRSVAGDEFTSEPITLYLEPLESEARLEKPQASSVPATQRPNAARPAAAAAATAPSAGESAAIAEPGRVDWPLEGQKSAARVLAREAEAERIARMFAGPGGTWASLTKRQRSKLNKFRFKPGIDGLEYDAQGNKIFHITEGCVVVNSMFIACALGKPMVHSDMFDNMRQYFDEQRLPETDEGNGTEPEALRPANK
jgi:hypothetical protein